MYIYIGCVSCCLSLHNFRMREYISIRQSHTYTHKHVITQQQLHIMHCFGVGTWRFYSTAVSGSNPQHNEEVFITSIINYKQILS